MTSVLSSWRTNTAAFDADLQIHHLSFNDRLWPDQREKQWQHTVYIIHQYSSSVRCWTPYRFGLESIVVVFHTFSATHLSQWKCYNSLFYLKDLTLMTMFFFSWGDFLFGYEAGNVRAWGHTDIYQQKLDKLRSRLRRENVWAVEMNSLLCPLIQRCSEVVPQKYLNLMDSTVRLRVLCGFPSGFLLSSHSMFV